MARELQCVWRNKDLKPVVYYVSVLLCGPGRVANNL